MMKDAKKTIAIGLNETHTTPLIAALALPIIFIFCELVFSQEIKASEKILNESKVDVDSFTSYARISHTDNFILVDKNGKVYKSCLTRNPEGCPDPYLFYGYINTPILKKWFS